MSATRTLGGIEVAMDATITLTVADLAALMSSMVLTGAREALTLVEPDVDRRERLQEAASDLIDCRCARAVADPKFVVHTIGAFRISFAGRPREAVWLEIAARTIAVTLRGRGQ